MDIQIGNREKIAGILIVCLVAIGAVHWFVFMNKAHLYHEAYNTYQQQRGRWTQMVSTQQEPQINKFVQETQGQLDFVSELARALSVDWDPIYFDNSKEGVKKRQDRLLELIYEVADLRKKHPKLRLTFMDWRANQLDNPGWDIPSQLPGAIPLWDLVDKLKNTAMTLRVLSGQNPLERLRARYEYNTYLRGLGVNSDILDPNNPNWLGYRYGDLVPLIKKIAHARLIWAQKEKEEKGGTASSKLITVNTMGDLFDLLDLKLPDDPDTLFHAIKQLQFLIRLVKMAEAQGVEEINSVVLLPVRKVDAITDEDNKPRMVPQRHFDNFYMKSMGVPMTAAGGWPAAAGYPRPGWPGATQPAYPETDDGGDQRAAWQTGRAGRPALGPQQPGAATRQPGDLEPTPVPEPEPNQGGDWVGNAVPIELGFVASWDVALDFIWVISHNQNPFEIDAVQLRAAPGGKIQMQATLVPMAWVKMIEALLFAPAGTTATMTAAAAPTTGPAPSRLGGRRGPMGVVGQ